MSSYQTKLAADQREGQRKADEFNAAHPIGTLVLAYPGCRPEDGTGTQLVTRTRTVAQVSASGDAVVWVDGEGSYICLTHVDPVSESEWQAAREAETATVAERGAFPKPERKSRTMLDHARDALRARMTKDDLRLVLENTVTYAASLEARVAELEARNRRTPQLCICGHSPHAHTAPAPHSCFAFGQTCPCPTYRQLPHDEAEEQFKRNLRAAEARQHYDTVPDPADGCHWCACGNRWPCKNAPEVTA